jgi:hypothetical protein
VVVVSAAVNVLHTASHAGQHIMSLPLWQLAFIALVIFATPVVAAVLLWTRYRVTGAWLLAASMAGSLVFGLLYHFLVPGSDNVFAQPPGTWRSAFVITAVLLSLLQATGVVVGLRVARGTQGGGVPAAGRDGARDARGRSDVPGESLRQGPLGGLLARRGRREPGTSQLSGERASVPCGSSLLCWASGWAVPTWCVVPSSIPCAWRPSGLSSDHQAVGVLRRRSRIACSTSCAGTSTRHDWWN